MMRYSRLSRIVDRMAEAAQKGSLLPASRYDRAHEQPTGGRCRNLQGWRSAVPGLCVEECSWRIIGGLRHGLPVMIPVRGNLCHIIDRSATQGPAGEHLHSRRCERRLVRDDCMH
jgi:hypothetical protein